MRNAFPSTECARYAHVRFPPENASFPVLAECGETMTDRIAVLPRYAFIVPPLVQERVARRKRKSGAAGEGGIGESACP